MMFDNVIQVGVWVGSAEQIQCIAQTAGDANFEDWQSIDQYLEEIEALHNEEETDSDRGPIDADARARYETAFRDAWDRQHDSND